ncbi:MAG: IS110 family transposase [Rhizobiaceae bacterium]|nr:IS110 family transposase [Rhizobiaceae bacterium]
MSSVSMIGIDLAKNVFQLHGCDQFGAVVFRKKLRREGMITYLAKQPACLVAMEACTGSHYWGREIERLGHVVRLIPPAYVKPFVKRQKNDAADAEAICEAAMRPTMRFVAVKNEECQAAAIVFRTRDLLIRQRTQTINALRGYLAEFGIIVAQGPAHVGKLVTVVEDQTNELPDLARSILGVLIETMEALNARIDILNIEITRRSKEDDVARRLMTIPGIGPLIATALPALAPAANSFKRGRDFAAWLGLTPLQHSTGGKQKLGRTSKMGERTLRRLLIIGASAVVRWAARKGAAPGSWLDSMLKRKPIMLVTVALANKIARIAWAIMAKGGVYQAPVAAA